jgi:uncharacterized membrane protein (Fun14 family)
MTAPDVLPLVSTVGGGFLAGALAGYALKKVMKIAAVIVGLFIAALAYLEYQRIINIDWDQIQASSQNGITWIANIVMDISNNIGATHTGAFSYLGLPLASGASAGFALGMARG